MNHGLLPLRTKRRIAIVEDMNQPSAHRVRVLADEHGDLNLTGLDLAPGEEVEIVVLRHQSGTGATFPLRGKAVEYVDPTEPVAASDWEV